MAHGLFEAFVVARVVPALGGTVSGADGGPSQRGALFCRFEPPGARGVALPAAENLLPFCWPLGIQAVKPSPYLVTCEFSFTLTGGDGQRLHGFCRKTHDPTHKPIAVGGTGTAKGGMLSAVEQKRFPQVMCILSQHCWPAFFSKVLEVVDQLLTPHAALTTLPPDAPAALFMSSLPRLIAAAGPAQPPLGAVLRVPLPLSGAPISVDRMRRALAGPSKADMLLGLSPDAIELEVPPNLGNGVANAGVSLARLLWFLTPRQAVTLVASLLLERRIILVARDAETVSSAVHAANALLYPFRWQHIYLPLLPLALKDYLAAPMPYLAGVQADCLPLLKGLPLEEVVMIDLDVLGSCTPELGSAGDDYHLLPYARELEDVFEVVREHIRSPTEFDSTPKCNELLQNFFLRLMGGYRQFVRPDDEVTPAALALGLQHPAPSSKSSTSSGGRGAEENPRAHGYVFDQAAFTAAHRRKDKVAAFLAQFRNSQMLEVFITERLKLASEGYVTEDPFELKVTERNTRTTSVRLGLSGVVGVPGMQKGRISGLLRKAGSAMKQSGGSLVASIQRLGTSQQEELHVAGRALSGPNLSRLSPGPGGLGRASPGIGAAAVVTHSHNSSISSRSSSYTNLHRASANLAALNGGLEPSLEQLRPDMFFGVDEEDDASSVTSDAVGADSFAAQRPHTSPGPLEKAMGASRSFGSLFQPAARSPPQQHVLQQQANQQQQRSSKRAVGSELLELFEQQQSEASALAAIAAAAATSRGVSTNSSASFSGVLAPQVPSALGSPGSSFVAPSTAVFAGIVPNSTNNYYTSSSSPAAAFAGPLLDLQSPGLDAARAQQRQQAVALPHARPQQLFPDAAAAQARSVNRNSSNKSSGWATFDEDVPLDPTNPFLQADGSRIASWSTASPPPRSNTGPLGSSMASNALYSGSRSLPVGASAQPEARLQQGPPVPTAQQQHGMQVYQQAPARFASLPPLGPHGGQRAGDPCPTKPPPQVKLDGASFGFGPLASQPPAAGVHQAASPLPAACRHTAHSPLGAGMGTVHRLASIHSEDGSGFATPSRRASSTDSAMSAAGLHVQPDAFATVAAAAAVDISQHMPLGRRSSSASSHGSGNRFREAPPPGPQQPLSRQVTGVRELSTQSSFGEWSAAWPATNDGPLGSGMPAGGIQPPSAQLAALYLHSRPL